MTREPLTLSRATRAHLARLPTDTPIAHTARLHAEAGPTVGLCVTEAIPPGLLLPPGLSWVATAGATAGDLCDSASAAPAVLVLPPIVTLRYRAALRCPSADPGVAAQRIARASLVAVAGAVLHDGATLHDVTSKRGASTPLRVELYEAADAAAARSSESSGTGSDGAVIDLPVAPAARPAGAVEIGLHVQVDVLTYLAAEATRDVVLDALAAGARAQIAAAALVAPARARVGHFRVLGEGLCATFVWATRAKDADGVAEDVESGAERRRAVHAALGLPQDRPLLRAGCRAFCGGGGGGGGGGDDDADAADKGRDKDGRLKDVHVGVKGHGMGGAAAVSEHLVDGSYAYCHYRQDRIDDGGWGCAYRSLQTIVSWAVDQGYAAMSTLPSHAAIQRALVAVGDKPPSFAGSREWIGANEVCYALQRLTGLDSRIVHVPSGADMGAHGRELARHFDEHGSPVMVGGGVLAWTILGVARDERTGRTNFLILDPHYEGRDVRAVVQSKGWIAWKDDSIFRRDAFYNLCMPLRPSGV